MHLFPFTPVVGLDSQETKGKEATNQPRKVWSGKREKLPAVNRSTDSRFKSKSGQVWLVLEDQ